MQQAWYINVNSNHPYSVIKNLPEGISLRISKYSSDKTVFNHFKELFNNTLPNSGFDYKSSFCHSLKVKIATVIKPEDETKILLSNIPPCPIQM